MQAGCGDKPVSVVQNNATYYGHWHGNYAVFTDGSVFRAGSGWLDHQDSKRMIEKLCH
jgi:hypothetical protein